MSPFAARMINRLLEWSVLTAVFFLPFSKSAAEIGVFAALALWLVKRAVLREPFEAPALFKISYALYLAVMLLSLIHAPQADLATAWRGVFKWLKYLGLFFLCEELCRDKTAQKKMLTAFMISLALLTLNGYLQLIQGADWIKHYSVDIPGRLVRMKSSLQSPNDLAAFYLFGLPLAFRAWHHKEKWSLSSALACLMLAAFFVAFVATLSRSAFLALAATLCVYAVCRRRAWIFLAIALLTGTFLVSTPLKQNFFESVRLKDKTISERLRYWKITGTMIKKSPLIGLGVNTYTRQFARFAPPEEKYRGYAHNFILQMWAEVGIIGLLFFLIPLAVGLFRAWRASNSPGASSVQDALLVGITAYVIQGLFDTNFYAMQVTILFWLFWGCLQGMRRCTS